MSQPIKRVCKKTLTLKRKTQLNKNLKTSCLIYRESFTENRIRCVHHHNRADVEGWLITTVYPLLICFIFWCWMYLVRSNYILYLGLLIVIYKSTTVVTLLEAANQNYIFCLLIYNKNISHKIAPYLSRKIQNWRKYEIAVSWNKKRLRPKKFSWCKIVKKKCLWL